MTLAELIVIGAGLEEYERAIATLTGQLAARELDCAQLAEERDDAEEREALEKARGENAAAEVKLLRDAFHDIERVVAMWKELAGIDEPVTPAEPLVRCTKAGDCNGEGIAGVPCGHHAEHRGNGDCGAVCARDSACEPVTPKGEAHQP